MPIQLYTVGGSTQVAYTIRPDLWPPGWAAWDGSGLNGAWWAYRSKGSSGHQRIGELGRQALRLGLGQPGQAEAAILAGHAWTYPPKMPGVAWGGS